ncbi:MAG: penicillin-binding protein 1A [Desulfovibrionaceae bacterium]
MKTFLKIFAAVVLLLAVLGAGGTWAVYKWASKDLPNFTRITDYAPALVTTVYDSDGGVLGYFYKERRWLVKLDDMNKWLPLAFLASEDNAFYDHEGVDVKSIFRAFWVNLKAGGIKQGGSTITQQVVKQLLLTNERSYERKLKEAILAYRLEKYLTKEEILTIYLNQIFLGAHSYGVEAACRSYFGKHASEVSLAEAATLAGLPQAPSRYNPFENPDAAKDRQRYVLGQMRGLGWITAEEEQAALEEEIELTSMPDPSWGKGAYYLEEVRRWLIEKYGEETVYTKGLSVYTACDPKHQAQAEQALKDGLVASAKRRGWAGAPRHVEDPVAQGKILVEEQRTPEELTPGAWVTAVVDSVSGERAKVRFGHLRGIIPVESVHWCRKPNPEKATDFVPSVKDVRQVLKPGDVVSASVKAAPAKEGDPWTLNLEIVPEVQGAIVSMDPKSGEVLALSGGFDYLQSEFNRATQAKRQPGSAFKPIVYSVAIDNGFTPASLIQDTAIVFENSDGTLWRPENYENAFYGYLSLRTALVKSKNLVTIRVAQKVGVGKIIERAKALGLQADFPYNLSVALGSAEVTLMNLCQAYTAMPRQGSWIEARLVRKVEDVWGETLFESEPVAHEAISPQTAFIISRLMQEVVSDGTGRRALALGRPVAGKTGTSNEERDAWFMGFAPYLLTGVYVGFDEPRPMGQFETGSRAALPIWLQYRQAVEDDYPAQDFPQPEGVVMAKASFREGSKDGLVDVSYFLPFKEGTQPAISDWASSGAGGSALPADDDLFKQGFE